MLHPVGDLPAAVYWRRRALVLTLLLSVLGGGGWLGWAAFRDPGRPTAEEAAATTSAPLRTPALELVVPSLASVQTPSSVPATTTATRTSSRPAATTATTPAPRPGGPCTDGMIGLEVRAPGRVAVGSKPTFELRVRNTSRVPCVRPLDKELQELVLLDGAGRRMWGSNDCFPEQSDDRRTLAPGEVVVLPLTWGGRTSEPTCRSARATPPAGTYLLRARLDTKTAAEVRLVIR